MPPRARSQRHRGRLESVSTPLQRCLRVVRSAPFRGDPDLGFLEQRVHLGEQGTRRSALALERLDSAQSPHDGARFVHAPTLATTSARVCARIASKAVRFLPAVAPNPDRELGEARAAIDRGDALVALKHLDQARRGYFKQRDGDGLEHVLDMAQLVDIADDRARVGRDNLAYAVKQNLRQESRRQARERGEPWSDPYPDLQAPAEHTGLVITRPVKIAISVGVALGTALLLAILVLPWFFESNTKSVTLRLVNDTPQRVTVRGCFDAQCDTSWLHRDLEPGQETETGVDPDDLVELFQVERSGRDDACLPARIHDGYRLLDGGQGTLALRLSEATPCPGSTVLPEPASETGI
jgi:hypothetical protein